MQPDQGTNDPNSELNKTPTDSDSRPVDTFHNEQVAAAEQVTQPVTPPLSTQPLEPTTTTGLPLQQPPKKSKKGLIIGIIAAVLVLLGGGAVLAYSLYNKPEKVLTDALDHALQTKQGEVKGVVSIKSTENESPYDVMITMDAKNDQETSAIRGDVTLTQGAVSLKFAAQSVITLDGTYFVKVENVDGLTDNLFKTFGESYGMETAALKKDAQPLIDKVNNKWIKITPADVKEVSGSDSDSDKTTKCVQDVVKSIRDDSKIRNEITDAYRKNAFLAVDNKGSESINGTASFHYAVTADDKKGEAFGNALKDTTAFKKLKECDASFDSSDTSSDSSSDDTKVTSDLWVSQWSHDVTRLKLHAISKDSVADIQLDFSLGKKVTVDVPTTDIVTFKDIETTAEKVYQDVLTDLYGSYDVSSDDYSSSL
jgi:hypothetical protein